MLEALTGTVLSLFPNVAITQASNFPDAIAQSKKEFDMCISDLVMPGADPLVGIASIIRASPTTPLLVVTGSADDQLLTQLIAMGVAGFTSKTSSVSVIEEAIKQVFSGEHYLPTRLEHAVIEAVRVDASRTGQEQAMAQPNKLLTARQITVVGLVAKGQSNKEIARTLSLAPSTVKTHLVQIMGLMETSNRTETAFKAKALGLI